jgi:tripartite-type tricarboxylate transporter receptor subunit TctC
LGVTDVITVRREGSMPRSPHAFEKWLLMLPVCWATAAGAQVFPSKPIRFLSTGAGASTDLAARTVALGLADSVGWQVVVDNRGNTIVAAELAARAPPDGYTWLVLTEGLWRGPLLQSMPYDMARDFLPVSLLTRAPNVLVVHPSLPVKSVKELIALAKSRPGELNYGAGAIGASTFMSSEMFKHMAGVNLTFVSYKSSGAAVTAIVSGELQVMFGSTGGISPHVRSGRVRALAISSLQPSPLMPGVPTIAAAGNLPGYESAATACVFAPAATADALVNRMADEVRKVLAKADVRERLLRQSVEPVGMTPLETAAYIKADTAATARLVREAGIKLAR